MTASPTGSTAVSHIAIAVPGLEGGGAERVTANLANELVRRGVRVDVVILGGTSEGEAYSLDRDVNIVRLRARWSLVAFPRLVRYLKSERPDWLMPMFRGVSALAVLGRSLAAGVRVVSVVHNTYSEKRRRDSGLRPRLFGAMMPLIYRTSDLVVAVSEGVKRDLVENYGLTAGQVEVIHNPLITPRITRLAAEELEEPAGNGQRDLIVSAGRFVPQKNFSLLLEAFSLLARSREARLIILGEGAERKKICDRARKLGLEDMVSLPGFVENPYKYFSRADVFVLSSDWEGFGNVLVEAMAVGCPVVSTDCPSGPAEILREGEYGELVQTGDAEALAGAIERTLAEPVESDRLRRRAGEFSVERAVDRYLTVLREAKG